MNHKTREQWTVYNSCSSNYIADIRCFVDLRSVSFHRLQRSKETATYRVLFKAGGEWTLLEDTVITRSGSAILTPPTSLLCFL